MDDRVEKYLDELRKQLSGLPEKEIEKALEYYAEYFSEASEAGKEPEEVIGELGTAEEVAGNLRTETSIIKAQNEPGLRNFNSAYRNAFRAVTRPISVFWLSIAAVLSYGIVVLLFGGAVTSLLSAVAVVLAFAYEGARIPARFPASIAGAAGAAIFLAGLLTLIYLYLWRLGKLFIRLSANLIGTILKMSGSGRPAGTDKGHEAKPADKRAVYVLLACVAAGVVLMGFSGLPGAYFTLFNSMEPGQTRLVEMEYLASEVDRLEIKTANSAIRVNTAPTDKIKLTYNEPAWFEHQATDSGGLLSFRETPNGMLPFSMLYTLHEGMTEVVLTLPEGYRPGALELESTGGHITLKDYAGSVQANTLNGNISCSLPGAGEAEISAIAAGDKEITVSGGEAGEKTGSSKEYHRDGTSGAVIRLTAARGNIKID